MPVSARVKNTKNSARRGKTMAASANKFDLYEQSVQDPDADIKLIQRIFVKERQRKPMVLREDFCGTAKLCAAWVHRHPERRAVGVDIDAPTLVMARKRHIEPLGVEAKRVQLIEGDVLASASKTLADVTVAFNFSYCCFKERAQMLSYMQAARRGLCKDGAFLMDIHGGTECFEAMEETTRHKGFTYVWDQQPYDAVRGHALRHIHFRFPDGSEMRRAFTYDWRLWTLPELIDLMTEAGFKRVDVYWEGSDAKGRGNGVFRRVPHAQNEAAWIAYVVGWK